MKPENSRELDFYRIPSITNVEYISFHMPRFIYVLRVDINNFQLALEILRDSKLHILVEIEGGYTGEEWSLQLREYSRNGTYKIVDEIYMKEG